MSTEVSRGDELHKKLYKALRDVVATTTSRCKQIFDESKEDLQEQEAKIAVPISFLSPDDRGEHIIQNLMKKHENKQARVMMFPIEEISFSFQLPAGFPLDQIDVEKLVTNFEKDVTRKGEVTREFSVFERLEGWNIECRERPNEHTVDSYFLHEKLKKVLRSVNEVVGFILYEDPLAVRYEKRKASSALQKQNSRNKRVNMESGDC